MTIVADAFTTTFGAAFQSVMAVVSPIWQTFVGWFSSATDSATASWSALWDTNQSAILQLVDLVKDAFTITVNYVAGLWTV